MNAITLKPSTHIARLALFLFLLTALFTFTACNGPDGERLSGNSTEGQNISNQDTVSDDSQSIEADSQQEASAVIGDADAGGFQDASLEEATFSEIGPVGLAAQFEPEERADLYDGPPPMILKPDLYYYATIVTERGDINIQLFPDRAPLTVNNFVYLARDGFYDNTTFHRVLDGFMAQAGDPLGIGSGGPGYEFEDEFYPGLGFDRPGLLAMANAGPDTNGSQFFITYSPTSHLTDRHVIFGEVTEGMDVLNTLTLRDPNMRPDYRGDLIYTITIQEWNLSYLPTPTPVPPTPTPLPTPTPFAPTDINPQGRPLAELTLDARANYFNIPPEMEIDTTQQYIATFTTDKGDLVAELYAEQAPVAVNNFIALVNLGFYDGMPVNQVIPGQVAIIGSPDNNPRNDAGYRLQAEIGTDIALDYGSLGYVSFEQNPVISSSSQLLIALIAPAPQAGLDFSFFGKFIQGTEINETLTTDDVVEKIEITVGE